MKLPEQFIEEIKPFETIFCLVSGGWHSTTAALLLFKHKFKNVILVHNKTWLEMKSSLKTMQKLQQITGYEYIEIEPDLGEKTIWDVMKESFQKIPEVREDIQNKKYDRNKFSCCKVLKKGPSAKYFRKLENCIVVDSQCPYESNRRSFYLAELRKKEIYFRYLKSRGFWKIYPFRDILSKKQFIPFINFTKSYIPDIKHSGCIICPILICFNMYKEERYYNSLKAMSRAGLPCFQKTIMDYLEG